jgi:hypothetical protein
MSQLKLSLALLFLVLAPSLARAQASIGGVVRDTSGAVLPGATVEASSPALIEKVRSVTTDGTGQYKIVDLRPGIYTVTFTLTGFSAFKREGVELTGSNTVTVNADLTKPPSSVTKSRRRCRRDAASTNTPCSFLA